jgi:2-methylisocitrate lyase-like PEP mutase family enzyme
MDLKTQKSKAEHLLSLHRGPEILVICNAWDAGSARIFEAAGAKAIASTSAGVANAQGYPDGEKMPLEALLATVRRIAETVSVPVSADAETGYSHGGGDIESVVVTCKGVLQAGAVGVNLEDTTNDSAQPLVDAYLQVEKLQAVREMAQDFGVHLVITARTDGYWLKLGDEKTRLADTIRRIQLYREAGADCVFIPGAHQPEVIRTLLRESPGPMSVLAMPGCPSVKELQELGVTRTSQGSGPARAALALTRRIAGELLQHGTYRGFHENSISYAELNSLFERN